VEYGFHFKHRYPRMLSNENFAHDCRRTLVCAEYGYQNRSPNTNG
jgi:hypothetical protein